MEYKIIETIFGLIVGVVLIEVIFLIVYFKLKSKKEKLIKIHETEANKKQTLSVAKSEADAVRIWEKGRADALKLEAEARVWRKWK